MVSTRRSPRLHPKLQPQFRHPASPKVTKENEPLSRKIQQAKESYGRDHKRELSDNPRARNPNIAPRIHLGSGIKTKDHSMDRICLLPGDSQSLGVLDSTEKIERLHPYRAENSGYSEFSSNRRRRSPCPSPESEQFQPSLKRSAAVLREPKARARSEPYIFSAKDCVIDLIGVSQ